MNDSQKKFLQENDQLARGDRFPDFPLCFLCRDKGDDPAGKAFS